jgi:hypothetical protein
MVETIEPGSVRIKPEPVAPAPAPPRFGTGTFDINIDNPGSGLNLDDRIKGHYSPSTTKIKSGDYRSFFSFPLRKENQEKEYILVTEKIKNYNPNNLLKIFNPIIENKTKINYNAH